MAFNSRIELAHGATIQVLFVSTRNKEEALLCVRSRYWQVLYVY
jgi:hypothetical protein